MFSKISKLTLVSTLLALSLVFTVISHTVGAVSSVFSSALSSIGLSTTISTMKDAEGLRQLRSTKKLSDMEHSLNIERKKVATLQSEIAGLKNPTVVMKGKRIPAKQAVTETIDKISARMTKLAAATIGEIPAEAIPFVGVGVILTTAALEVKAACDTMTDLHELGVALVPDSAVDNGHKRVCGKEVPKKQEVIAGWKGRWKEIRSASREWWDHLF